MKLRLAAVCIVCGALAGPICQAAERDRGDRDMQRAISWERWKDRAAEIQARKEARHPSVTYGDRSANRETVESGRRVIDAGPPAYRKDKK